MKQKIAVTLDKDLVGFLDLEAKGNRSEYINNLLVQKRQEKLEVELIQALQQDIESADYLCELADWDIVAEDGIGAER